MHGISLMALCTEVVWREMSHTLTQDPLRHNKLNPFIPQSNKDAKQTLHHARPVVEQ